MAASLIFYIKNHLYTFLLIVQYYNVQQVLRSIPLYVNPYGSFGPLRKTKYFLKKSVSFIFFFFFIFVFVFHIIFNGKFGPRLVFLIIFPFYLILFLFLILFSFLISYLFFLVFFIFTCFVFIFIYFI